MYGLKWVHSILLSLVPSFPLSLFPSYNLTSYYKIREQQPTRYRFLNDFLKFQQEDCHDCRVNVNFKPL